MHDIIIRRANENDDFTKIAEILYHTDPYIYPTAFGNNTAEASQAISILIMAEGSVFDFRNMFVAVANDTICGVILYNESGAAWDSEKYYNLIRRHIPNKQKFIFTADNYFIEQATKPEANHVEIIALSVSKPYQRMGIATMLLGAFIQEYNSKTIQLDVLADNAGAIRLYSKFGFMRTAQTKGFSYTDDTKPDCYRMVRN